VRKPKIEALIAKDRGLDDTHVVWIDGSSRPRDGAKSGGIGIFWSAGDKKNLFLRLDGPKVTNNRAELQAAICALYQAKSLDLPIVTLRGDSEFVANLTNRGWLKKWSKNDWRKADNQPIKNPADIYEYDVMTKIIESRFVHTPKSERLEGIVESHNLANQAALHVKDERNVRWYKMTFHGELYERVMQIIREDYPKIPE